MSTQLLRTSRYGKPLAALLISLAGALWAGGRWSAAAQDTNTYIELERPRTDLTGLADESTVVPVDLVTPEAARNIGPGSALIITIPDEGRFGCTANFVWASGENLYLGAAGHCFLPETRKATHGAGADYDASGVTVQVCVENCETGFQGILLLGTLVEIGRVAYARQTNAAGDEQIGHDFGVVQIPAGLAPLVRRSIPVFGGPTEANDKLESGELACHYGNGVGAGETFLTKGRVGVGGGSDQQFWMGDFAATFGDSGSALVTCDSDILGFHGRGAVGVLTHLGLQLCPCDVNFKNLKIKAQQGVVFGTTTRRAIEMAREAGLSLSVLLP